MEAMKGGCVCVYHMAKMVSFIILVLFHVYSSCFRDEAHENYGTEGEKSWIKGLNFLYNKMLDLKLSKGSKLCVFWVEGNWLEGGDGFTMLEDCRQLQSQPEIIQILGTHHSFGSRPFLL